MEDKKTYKCEYCNKEYSSPIERAKCEIACETRIKKEQEEKRKKELELVKETRHKEVEEAFEHYATLKREYIRDYGSYSTVRGYNNDLLNWLFD